MLGKGQPQRETSFLDTGPSLYEVECQTEERTICRVHNEATGKPDVGVVAAKQAPVERLLESPHRRGDGSCQRCAHTL